MRYNLATSEQIFLRRKRMWSRRILQNARYSLEDLNFSRRELAAFFEHYIGRVGLQREASVRTGGQWCLTRRTHRLVENKNLVGRIFMMFRNAAVAACV